MACNCKKNVNTKYVDNENFGYTEIKKINGLAKMGKVQCRSGEGNGLWILFPMGRN